MKTEFVDVNETKKNLLVEIPSSVVDAEIERITKDYSRAARIPGFRPGKVPPKVVKQRFREQIMNEVAHGLIPHAVDNALREQGIEPVDTPDISDVVIEEGQPLKFTATFETVPPIDPGDCASIKLKKPAAQVEPEAVDRTLERLRQQAARFEPVEGRAVEAGDTVVVDLERRSIEEAGGEAPASDKHENVSVEIGAAVNPPGFDEQLTGLNVGDTKTFTVTYPEDYPIGELKGKQVDYTVAVKGIKRRIVPELDDELAKDLGEFDTLDQLRARVAEDLQREAEQAADRQVRGQLLTALAERVTFDVPSVLVEREVDRRMEEFVRRLIDQQVDPRRANIDWEELRKNQAAPASESVRSALVLDEVARREQITVTDEEIDREIERFADRSGRTVPAVRAQLEKEGGLGRLRAGLRRERAVEFLLSCATLEQE